MIRFTLIALVMMTSLSLSMNGQEADDYKPFVETIDQWTHYPDLVKEWNVIHTQPGDSPDSKDYSTWLSDNYSFDRYELINERMVVKDRVYYKMNINSRSHGQKEFGVREDNRKVYVYSETDEKEYLLYDFSLKEGDTCAFYDIDSGEMVKLKVLKEGTFPEATWIYPHNTMLDYETMVEQKRPLRTWVMGVQSDAAVYPPEYLELFTMIEGIGCNEGPFFSYDKTNGYDYLAYVVGPEREVLTNNPHSISAYDDIMFPVSNTRFAKVRGCDMKTYDENGRELSDEHIVHDLTFEFDNGQLHVYGDAYTACGAWHYAYFIEEPTEDPFVHILRLKIEISSFYFRNHHDCMKLHPTDFYVPGFGSGDIKDAPEGYDPAKIDYIVVDEYGNEYSVINKQTQTISYIPFIQQNKEWKVRWNVVGPYENTHWNSQKYIISGDTVISGRRCSKMYSDDLFSGVKGNYILSMYEENGKVYFIPKNTEEEHLLYDFTANVGDIVRASGLTTHSRNGSDIEFLVRKTEVRKIEGLKRKCLLVVPKEDYNSNIDEEWAETLGEWWIEGIGTQESPIEHYTSEYEGAVHFLEYCKNGNGNFLYHHAYTPPVCMVDRNMSWIQEYADADGSSGFSDIQKQHVFFKTLSNSLNVPLYASALGDEENAHIVAALREEEGKVYICPWKHVPSSYLLYDFSAKEGDVMEIVGIPASNRYEDEETIPDLYTAKCRIEKVEEKEIEGVRRRCLYVQEVMLNEDFSDNPSFDDVWIEGIGSVRGILGNVSFEIDGKAPFMKLLECSWYDEIYYREDDYQEYAPSRRFIEEGKVWKIGNIDFWDLSSDNPVEKVEYFYFDGDTIIDGKVCKRMMERDCIMENSSDYDDSDTSLIYVGAWYENGNRVYFAAPDQPLHLMYDFSVSQGDTVRMDDGLEFTFTKTIGDIKGFKGRCYNLNVPVIDVNVPDGLLTNVWLEGVGSATRPNVNLDIDLEYFNEILLSCIVGDEVIYLNERYEDIVTPDPETPKRRIDFTHTVKVKPKAPVRRSTDETENTLTGDYSDRLLNIDLGKLNNEYNMVIKNQSGSVVYVKSVRANEIVALNIDISKYTDGNYTINIENADEVFSGIFSINPTAIYDVASDTKQGGKHLNDVFYDLTGRPVSKDRLSKGIYIQNGKKVLVR